MGNHIVISIEFYFKGQKHLPSTILDLDMYIQNGGGFDALYPMLANNNNIDLYSYEYEVMLAEDILFSDATGLATNFLEEGKFDFVGFEQEIYDESIAEVIIEIASTHLSVNDLSTQPELKAALLAAFKLGKQSEK